MTRTTMMTKMTTIMTRTVTFLINQNRIILLEHDRDDDYFHHNNIDLVSDQYFLVLNHEKYIPRHVCIVMRSQFVWLCLLFVVTMNNYEHITIIAMGSFIVIIIIIAATIKSININ